MPTHARVAPDSNVFQTCSCAGKAIRIRCMNEVDEPWCFARYTNPEKVASGMDKPTVRRPEVVGVSVSAASGRDLPKPRDDPDSLQHTAATI